MNPPDTVVPVLVDALPPIPDLTAGEGQIRPFTRDDLPAVAELRRQVFQHSARPAPRDLTAFLARAFFDPPWRPIDLPSYVHLDRDGQVNGFVGVMPRTMRFEGRLLQVAVPTQLMMRPGATAGSGLRLVRAIYDGPQDLTFSDAANEAARRLWERVGGVTSFAHSLHWTVSVRRARHALAEFARTGLRRAVAFPLRPIAALLDRRDPFAPGRAPPPLISEPFDPVRELALCESIAASWPLHPEYGAAGLTWMLEELERRRDLGALAAQIVRDRRGVVVGWFLYYPNPGGVAVVVQLAARPGDQGRLLPALIAHAWEAGAVAVAGRMEPRLAVPLAALGATLRREGPWCLTCARDPRLLAAVLRGDGFLSRLEGEWWLNF